MTSTSQTYRLLTRIFDLLKGVISLALIVALVVGLPLALISIVGNPLPTEVPSFDLMRAHVEDGNIPDAFVIKTLAVVVWVVWAQLAVAVLAEGFALLRGRVAGRTPVLPGIQPFAGKLVASTVLIVSALSPSRSAAAVPIVPIETPAAVSEATAPAQPLDQLPLHALQAFAPPSGPTLDLSQTDGSSVSGTSRTTDPVGQYETISGDNWWDMAERLLGDGMRWSELRDLNLGKTMSTGELISEQTEIVMPGWRLDVPSDADPSLLSQTPLAGATATAGATADTADIADTGDIAHTAAVGRPDMLVYSGPTGATDEGPLVPYEVVAGDNLWDIAERHLGDPFRWPEIYENSSQLEQSFGRTISDPNLIWPESILQLPSDATDVPTPDPQLVLDVLGSANDDQPEQPLTEILPSDLQQLTESAQQTIEPEPQPVTEIGPEPEPEIEPEPELELVASGAQPPDGSDTQPPPDGSDTESPPEDRDAELKSESKPEPGSEEVDQASEQSDSASEQTPAASLPGPAALSFGAGGLLLATGLLGMLDRARKLRLSEAAERQQPAPPPLELTDIETVLRNSADSPRSELVYQAVRSLADRPIVIGEPVATPEVIRISRDRVEVVQRGLDSSLPSPWLVGKSPALEFLTDRSLAVLPAERFSEEAADQASGISPAPACVTVGGGLLLNLEAVGLLGISGPSEQAAGLVRSMVHELATGPDGRSLDIRVSNWIPGAELHQHVRCSPLDHLAEELESWLEGVEMSSTAAGGMNAYGLRVAEPDGPMSRSVIVFADVGDVPALEPLIERARRRSLPLAVVLVGDDFDGELGCEAVIRLEARTLKLEPHGFTAATQFVDVDVLEGAERLIGHAGQAAMVPRRDDQSAIDASFDHNTDPAQVPTEETPEHEIVTEMPDEESEITDQSDDADTGLLIRVLGPIEIEGGPPELTEPERSLITFLALVGPSTEAQIIDAVWPAGSIDHDEFEETMARLRGLLGLQFPEPVDGRYRLRSTITDLGSARRWIVQAKSMSAERARSLLQLALADVRGEPFSGGGERHWQWIADHKLAIATQASAMLIDACFDLCDSAYAADDLQLAKWACDVGALVDPLHETVVTRRIQLLQLLDESVEAASILSDWESRYEATAGRPAPQRARLAMQTMKEAAPHVG